MGLSQPKPWVGYPHANFNRDSMGMCQLVLGLLDSLVTYFGASFELALCRDTTDELLHNLLLNFLQICMDIVGRISLTIQISIIFNEELFWKICLFCE